MINSPEQNISYISGVADTQLALISSGDIFSAIESARAFSSKIHERVCELCHQIFGVLPISFQSQELTIEFLLGSRPLVAITKNGSIHMSIANNSLKVSIETKHDKIERSFKELLSNV